MEQLFLYNAKVMLKDRVQPGSVLVREGRIAEVFTENDAPVGLSAGEKIDLRESFLTPGLIDIHIHGSVAVDVQNATREELAKLSAFLLGEGVTGYFATFVPTDDAGYTRAIQEIENYLARQDDGNTPGARILGIHFEGPFVSHEKCGALQRRHFRTYAGDPRSIEVFTKKQNPDLDYARVMTLAPEIEGGLKLIKDLRACGVRGFIGHTTAQPETLDAAVEGGAQHITHFPNALEPLHHRKPGAVAWGLTNDNVTFDCIADFHHVHPLMLKLMHKTKTAERMALISDAISPAGLGEGEYQVWGDRIEVRGGITALMDGAAKGTIAGSIITMRDALKNLASLNITIHDASRMASMIPAQAAGVGKDYGSIAEGKRADLIAFDENFDVKVAVIGGNVALNKM
jgi:N-acetylglucosamine-6-phosphate deacetylase